MSIRRLIPAALCFAMAAAGLTGMSSVESVASAQEGRSFLIPANDGYGIADCLAQDGSSCGRIVADAWCQAHGLGKSVAFGPVDATDMTASIKSAQATGSRSYTVTCAE
jgi:hypothetical protein